MPVVPFTPQSPTPTPVASPPPDPVYVAMAATTTQHEIKKQQASEVSILKNYVPVNIRQYLSHITGDTSELNESHLDSSDIDALKYAVKKDIKTHTKNGVEPSEGVIGYGDYSPKGFSEWAEGDKGHSHGPLDMIKNSYTDPAYRMETTLGMAKWKKDSEGNVIIEDKYNFAASENEMREAIKSKGVLGLISEGYRDGGLPGILNVVGNMFGSTKEKGNRVRIKLRLENGK